MKLADWIASNGGMTATAKLLDLTPGTVSKWLGEHRTPTIKTMLKIVKLSHGKVTLDTIIFETTPPSPRRVKRCKKFSN